MIHIQEDGDCLVVDIHGEFTAADFKEFENSALYEIRFRGPLKLLVDFTRMQSYTVDVVWHELRFMRQNRQAFDRVAVISDSQWMTWSSWVASLFVDAEVATFKDATLARAWLHIQG